MKTSPNHSTILTDITTNPELVENFMDYMKLITKQTGVDLVIDTQREGIARMQPGKTKVFFNPVFTLQQLQAIADKRAKELSVENTFQFTINHLSEIVLHEINHMINHTQLKMSKKTEKLDDKTLNMLDYQGQLYKKYGKDFKKFENMFEDIDVNNQATKLQAPVFETSKQEIYQHLCAPDTDFSEQPLPEQFAWASLRESMVTKEPCTIDPLVRMYITYASQPGWLLETIRNPRLSYDEQLPAIHKLYEDYYLPLQEEQKKREEEEKNKKENEWQQGEWQQGNHNSPEGAEQHNVGQRPMTGWNPAMTGQRPVVKPMQLPHLFDNPNGFPQNSEQTADTSDALRDALQGNPTQERQSQPEQQNNPLADQIQEALSQTIEEKILEDNKTPEDRSLEQFIAKERNLNPQTDKDQLEEIKQEIQQQKQLEQRVKKLTDNQGRNVYDTIVNEIFSKIVQIHKLPQIYEKSPRPFSEGGQFSASALAGGIMHRKSGDGDPLIMQQEAKKEKELKKAWAFNITLITDGSGSMSDPKQKNTDQKLSTLLMLYALQQLNDQLAEGDLWLAESFPIETQVLMFKGSEQVDTIKARTSQLWIKEVIEASKNLDYDDGNDTNAYDAIQQYYNQISHPLKGQSQEEYEKWLENVKEGKTKEILFVLSDGGFNSWDGEKAEKLIATLRERGIIVCGIWITKDGSPMVDIFGRKSAESEANAWGFGSICPQTSDLGTTLNSLLLEHLEDPSIIGD